jgi:hypothetical protein
VFCCPRFQVGGGERLAYLLVTICLAASQTGTSKDGVPDRNPNMGLFTVTACGGQRRAVRTGVREPVCYLRSGAMDAVAPEGLWRSW